MDSYCFKRKSVGKLFKFFMYRKSIKVNFKIKLFFTFRVFYVKAAFIRDNDKTNALKRYLKSLARINILTPTNSTFLNTWTPSPLVLAGLIPGKHIRGRNLKKYLFF